MLQYLKNRFFSISRAILSSIAFYPSLILVLFIFIAFTLLYLEDDSMTSFLMDNIPFMLIDNPETARSILTTLIGGIISLMVFSFSMVMVLLNQASSNFSPRLLPGLISDKNNQLVLGFYLGTIVYNIIITISILPEGNEYTLNGFSILVGIIFGVSCLGMFIFFIHSISTNIQINNILDKIYATTKGRLSKLIEKNRQKGNVLKVDDSSWKMIRSERSGYFQGVNLQGLIEQATAYEANIKVLPFKGKYLLPNMPLLKVDKSLDEEQIENLRGVFIYNSTDDVSDNYVLGIKQITEVGIKAMSPGINDPGTAIMTLDYLTELLALRMQVDEHEVYMDKDENYTIQLTTVAFPDLMYNCLAAYRQYCKHDLIIMEKMIHMLHYLKQQVTAVDSYKDVISDQLAILKEDSELNIENPTDQKNIMNLLDV